MIRPSSSGAMDADHYDKLETRGADERERDLLGRLPGLITLALRAPGWAEQLNGVNLQAVTSREALARLPLLRKSDLAQRQRMHPPLGGFNIVGAGRARRLLMSPGPIFEPESARPDFWGAARALFAAGFRAGDIVHNSFAYHLTPGGFIMESGAHALRCAIIPAGTGNAEQQVEAIVHLAPCGYVGTPDFLKVLLDTAARAGRNVSSLKRGLVSGAALPASLRAELAGRGVKVFQCYATADLGVIAYETEAAGEGRAGPGMIVNEDLLVEIVRPGTGDPVRVGEVGEIVVTSFNPDYPMIRLATGDLSAIMRGASSCGRTNMRLAGWLGRADQTTKIKGMFVHPEQVAQIAERHPELGRLRLVVTRANEQDRMALLAESTFAGDTAQTRDLRAAVAATLHAITKLRGEVELVPPSTLPNDGKVIADERQLG